MAEKHNIEYKESWSTKWLEWVCGFANAQGGIMYVGMDNNGNLVDIKNSHKLMEDIPNQIKSTMGIIPNVLLHNEDGKEYIEIDVQSYPVAISYKGKYFKRSGASNHRLTGSELESFMLQRRGLNWEASPMPDFKIDDIDDTAVEFFKKKAREKGRLDEEALSETKKNLMDKLQLIRDGYLTHAAALLFSDNPDKWFLGAYIKIGFFETDADLIYHDEIHGSLLQQVDKAMDLIYTKYLKAKITYTRTTRRERFPFPDAAVKEALLNALIHKQYESEIPIQVSVYDDRMYIANIGRLPETWTVDNLLGKHASKPYNPSIANVFYYAGFIESWGRGVEKIFTACKEDDIPEPEYTVHPGDIMIKFTAPEERVIRRVKESENVSGTNLGTDGTNLGTNGTKSQSLILNALINSPNATYDELSVQLKIPRRTIAREMKSLQDNGVIKRNGTNRNGYWEITNRDYK